MTRPEIAGAALGAAVLLGLGLGLLYTLLFPLRRRKTGLADGVFLLGLFLTWVYLSFGICGGDIRLFQLLGLLGGAAAFYLIPGRGIQSAEEKAIRRIRQKFQGRNKALSLFFRKRRKL